LFGILRGVTRQASTEEDGFVREVPVVWVERRRRTTAGGGGGRKELRDIFSFLFLK
jgi:hypothetical protein